MVLNESLVQAVCVIRDVYVYTVTVGEVGECARDENKASWERASMSTATARARASAHDDSESETASQTPSHRSMLSPTLRLQSFNADSTSPSWPQQLAPK